MARKLVSVAFNRTQFDHVARAARRDGKYLSAFIREAALTKHSVSEVLVSISEGSKLILYDVVSPSTVSYGTPIQWTPN